jgi:integrase
LNTREAPATSIDQYIHAATRDNTRRSYQATVKHFEVTWGGFLPATADSVARYLADHADTLSANTLQLRLSGLAQWHIDQGFPDPTKAPVVKKVLKGIRELHPAQERRARPLQLEELAELATWLDQAHQGALAREDAKAALTHARNRALLLLGFWRGFRSDELCRLRVEHVHVHPGQGMTLFLPRTKGDRKNAGVEYRVPALSQLCPVTAYETWIALANLSEGPVFRGINRWGHLSERSLTPHNLTTLLRRIVDDAGLASQSQISTHSLRRGFASWASRNGWDAKMLMDYVGWKDVHSAMRYIEPPDPFSQQRMEQSLSQPALPAPETRSTTTELLIKLSLTPYHRRVRRLKKVHALIERFCLKAYCSNVQSQDQEHYHVTVTHETPDHLDEILDDLLHQMHDMAQSHECILEVMIRDPNSGNVWE